MVLAGGGFLLAVLWMDLMFDVQVLAHRGAEPLPEPVIASIAAYYRRVTTDARPMSYAVSVAMLLVVLGVAGQIAAGASRAAAVISLALCGVPIVLALRRIFPNAMRLGRRSDPPAEQSRLARAICRDHLLCFACIAAFLTVQMLA
jgi:uncharacterized membrane protein YfcA